MCILTMLVAETQLYISFFQVLLVGQAVLRRRYDILPFQSLSHGHQYKKEVNIPRVIDSILSQMSESKRRTTLCGMHRYLTSLPSSANTT